MLSIFFCDKSLSSCLSRYERNDIPSDIPRLIMLKEESVVVSCVIYLNVSLHTYEIFCFS